ncbi:hypothetical protein [Marinobacterium rhizophilum]|uniref:Uncharacterized protein n=1 Tax=Marinobacterium rhizophilum TaxID=420402 RepID=A0ABY5HIP9_9GAMM|nr:hypothetical protein [Marinobacterium rhizophilum]UTW12143.1 hypothetical protein KDW95_00155 [Marinobacterium rhizophilum]
MPDTYNDISSGSSNDKKQPSREGIKPAVNASPNKPQDMQLLFMAGILGAVMGIVFIVIQPFFGMDTLTSRHAAAYQKLGNWNGTAAIAIAWVAHLAVSVFYGLLSGIVILKTMRLELVALFTLAFSWLTTVIAPPANAAIVQLVSFQNIQFSQLPSVNFSLDVKFVLHLVFFAAISATLYVYGKKSG